MRRHVLIGCIVLALSDPLLAQSSLSDAVGGGSRLTVPLTQGWRFSLADASGVEPPEAGPSWGAVNVPHTWNRVGYYLPPSPDRVNTPSNVNKFQGVGWYRLTFTPPESFNGKKAWLQFDAASRSAEVWLNGVPLGRHDGGFSRFRMDATSALKLGQPNHLVVKTDNSRPAMGSSTADILPLTGDFFIHGGLYRPVALVATNHIHLDMLDFGGPGVYVKTLNMDGTAAEITVGSKVRNDRPVGAEISVVTHVIDAVGRAVAEQSQKVAPAAQGAAMVEQKLRVPEAHLWQGVDDPYLYRVVIEVKDGTGALLDRVEQTFGIRQMLFDPNTGFFLNGKPMKLHGVGLHQDQEGLGWARDPADLEADIELIREMGANTIRLTHYQHGPVIHELADKYGLILWDEFPLVSVWTVASGQKEASAGLIANARQQLQELIRQNYNHPSVAVWGVANEVDFGNSMPLFLAAGGGAPPDPLPLLKELQSLARTEDPSRPTVQANCCEGRLFAENIEVPIVAPVTDLAGANRYFGWYYGQVGDLGLNLDALRASRPNQPLAVSEYGAGGATTMHTDNPRGGPVDSRGRDQPEEYQSFLHEASWAILKSKPYLWGTWLWSSFDFATTVRHEGDSDDINTKGLVTYDRKIKKDAFFFYKANWTNSPTVHVNGRRYVNRAYPVTDVRVYSNSSLTDLSLNGRSLGPQTDCVQMTCVWKDVRLRAGTNELVAIGTFSHGKTRDRIFWNLAAGAARRIRIDSGALMAADAASGRFGSDNFFEGGQAGTVNRPADYGKAAERRTIAGTTDSDVVATYRKGDFRYRIPLENGRYEVTLSFVEPSAAPGERQFDVVANGTNLLTRFDVASAAGGTLMSVKRRFLMQVRSGVLDLHFAPLTGKAIVSAIEVRRQ